MQSYITLVVEKKWEEKLIQTNVNIQTSFLTVESGQISLILWIANSIGYQTCNKVEYNLLERLKTEMIMGNNYAKQCKMCQINNEVKLVIKDVNIVHRGVR